uniref:TPX2 domain-containing protein n=1 Tax=Panagrellus redivivus TaxID=6233 RepID=A0A7E4VIK0_PANRE
MHSWRERTRSCAVLSSFKFSIDSFSFFAAVDIHFPSRSSANLDIYRIQSPSVMAGDREVTSEDRAKIGRALASINAESWMDFSDLRHSLSLRGDPLASQEHSYLKTPGTSRPPKRATVVKNKESQPAALNFDESGESKPWENQENEKPIGVAKVAEIEKPIEREELPKTALTTTGAFAPLREAARRRSANIMVEQQKHEDKKAPVSSSAISSRPAFMKRPDAPKAAVQPTLRAPARPPRSGSVTRGPPPARSASCTRAPVSALPTRPTSSISRPGVSTVQTVSSRVPSTATRPTRSASAGPARPPVSTAASTFSRFTKPNVSASSTTSQIVPKPGSRYSGRTTPGPSGDRATPRPAFMTSSASAAPSRTTPRPTKAPATTAWNLPRRPSPPGRSRHGSLTSMSSATSGFKSSRDSVPKPSSRPPSLRGEPSTRPPLRHPQRGSSRGPAVPVQPPQTTIPVTPKLATSARARTSNSVSTSNNDSKRDVEAAYLAHHHKRPTPAQLQATFNRLSKPKKR